VRTALKRHRYGHKKAQKAQKNGTLFLGGFSGQSTHFFSPPFHSALSAFHFEATFLKVFTLIH